MWVTESLLVNTLPGTGLPNTRNRVPPGEQHLASPVELKRCECPVNGSDERGALVRSPDEIVRKRTEVFDDPRVERFEARKHFATNLHA